MRVINNRSTIPAVRLPIHADEGAVLMHEWTVCVSGHWFAVPEGTQTDGASIPRMLWRLCGHPLAYPRVYVALLHDWLYGGGGRAECPTRADADAVYRDLLIHLWRVPYMTDLAGRPAKGLRARVKNAGVAVLNGIARVCAWTEWAALRLFGASHWHD